MTMSGEWTEHNVRYRGWHVVLASFIGLAFSPGPMIFASLGLFAPMLESEFGASRGQVMLTLTILNIASLLASPTTGRLLDSKGVRPMLLISQVAFALGLIAMGLGSGSLTALYIITAIVGAITVATQSISYTKAISTWFDERRGLAVGIAAAGLGLGFLIVPLIVGALLEVADWQSTLAVMGLLVLIIPFPVNYLIMQSSPSSVSLAQGVGQSLLLRPVIRSKQFILMATAIGLAAAVLAGIIPHLALMARGQGLTGGQAAQIAALYGLSTVLGRVVVGWLADRFAVTYVGALFFASSALGVLLIGVYGTDVQFAGLALLALLIGIGYGAESDIVALLIVRYFGLGQFGAIYGWLLSVFLLGASVGPPLIGLGFDVFGNYAIPMQVSAIVMAVAIWMLIVLERQPPLASPHNAG